MSYAKTISIPHKWIRLIVGVPALAVGASLLFSANTPDSEQVLALISGVQFTIAVLVTLLCLEKMQEPITARSLITTLLCLSSFFLLVGFFGIFILSGVFFAGIFCFLLSVALSLIFVLADTVRAAKNRIWKSEKNHRLAS